MNLPPFPVTVAVITGAGLTRRSTKETPEPAYMGF
jgi:hypothetical protein